MSKTSAQCETRFPVEFIPLREYEIPSGFTLRTEVSSFWRRLIPSRKEQPDELPTPGEYRRLGNQAQGRMVPGLKPEKYHEALDRLVSRVREGADGPQLLFVICEPFTPLGLVIEQWAGNNGRTIVPAPDPFQADEASHGDTLPDDPWLIPRLDDWFARHAFGLERVRGLIRRLRDRESDDGVVLCGGWAWEYLNSVTGLKPFSKNLYTLRSTDSETFAEIVIDFSEEASGHPVEYRNAENGEPVLRRLSDPENPEGTAVAHNDFIVQLISHARGNLAVASSLWAKSLRTEPEEVSDDSGDGQEQDQGEKRTYWTVSWTHLNLPEMPAGSEWNHTALLHSLLIHNGLPYDLMRRILPHTDDELTRSLSELEALELIERSGDGYMVTKPGYPAVRQHLHRLGYFTDPF